MKLTAMVSTSHKPEGARKTLFDLLLLFDKGEMKGISLLEGTSSDLVVTMLRDLANDIEVEG